MGILRADDEEAKPSDRIEAVQDLIRVKAL